MTVSQPYLDYRNFLRPVAVTVRHGDRVDIHRFANPKDAWAFYEEHTDDADHPEHAA